MNNENELFEIENGVLTYCNKTQKMGKNRF